MRWSPYPYLLPTFRGFWGYLVQANMIGVSLRVLQGWSQATKYLEVTPAEMLFMAFTFLAGKAGLKFEKVILKLRSFKKNY